MDDEALDYALVALAAIDIGAAAYALLNSAARRRAFKEAVRQAVESYGPGFVEADLVRIDGMPMWLITANHPWKGIVKYRRSFPKGTDPYSKDVLNKVIESLVNAIKQSQSPR